MTKTVTPAYLSLGLHVNTDNISKYLKTLIHICIVCRPRVMSRFFLVVVHKFILRPNGHNFVPVSKIIPIALVYAYGYFHFVCLFCFFFFFFFFFFF